jgi:hypothetical protein
MSKLKTSLEELQKIVDRLEELQNKSSKNLEPIKSGVNMNINPMEHFRAVEAKLRYERKKLEKAQIKEIKAKHNIRTIVVGDYTICYRVDKRDVIELSTAIRHPNDRFDRHVGELTALLKFCDMNRILLKNKMRISPKQFIRFIFTAADYSQPL